MLLPQHRQVSTPQLMYAVHVCAILESPLQSDFRHACTAAAVSCLQSALLMYMLNSSNESDRRGNLCPVLQLQRPVQDASQQAWALMTERKVFCKTQQHQCTAVPRSWQEGSIGRSQEAR